MQWRVEFIAIFAREFQKLPEVVQDNILAKSLVLQQFGPQLGRPHVDTLTGSRYSNIKELRLEVDSESWRVAFAFDSKRTAILLVAGNKTGKNQKRFYKRLIRIADTRLNEHLERLTKH